MSSTLEAEERQECVCCQGEWDADDDSGFRVSRTQEHWSSMFMQQFCRHRTNMSIMFAKIFIN